MHSFSKKIAFQVLYVLLVFGLGVFATEVVLRILSPKQYFIWPPHAKRTYQPNSEWLPGINGEGRFITNSLGIRGEEIPEDATQRMLTLGGSTTEALYLDQEETWPFLLQKNLNAAPGVPKTWVGNVGKSGHNSINHIYQMKYFVPQVPGLSTVILLMGANEVFFQPYWKTEFNPDPKVSPLKTDRENLASSFSSFPISLKAPYFSNFRQTALFFHFDRLYWLINKIGFYQDHQGKFHQKMRALKQAGKTYDKRPDISLGLDFYEQNLNTLVDLGQAQHLNVVFMTQPYAWNARMSEAEQKTLWWGWVYGAKDLFYTLEVQTFIFDAYNQRMLDVCRKRGIQCVDLAKQIPHDLSYFYDDIHFNEKGNAAVAQILAAFFGGMHNQAPAAMHP